MGETQRKRKNEGILMGSLRLNTSTLVPLFSIQPVCENVLCGPESTFGWPTEFGSVGCEFHINLVMSSFHILVFLSNDSHRKMLS